MINANNEHPLSAPCYYRGAALAELKGECFEDRQRKLYEQKEFMRILDQQVREKKEREARIKLEIQNEELRVFNTVKIGGTTI